MEPQIFAKAHKAITQNETYIACFCAYGGVVVASIQRITYAARPSGRKQQPPFLATPNASMFVRTHAIITTVTPFVRRTHLTCASMVLALARGIMGQSIKAYLYTTSSIV